MTLFDETFGERARREIAPGAVHVPGFLTAQQQSWIVDRFREWAAGPVPPHSPKVRGHEMSVRTVCLGWHWQPYRYTRAATDVNGNRVLDFPDWMVRLGRRALAEADPARWSSSDSSRWSSSERDEGASRIETTPTADYTPDTALVNFYDETAKMGMHQDRDERTPDPVVSLSIGDSCLFRFGNTESRTKPYTDLTLASGDLFVFGGPSRLAFHGIQKIYPGTAPESCGLERGRINITMRVTGLSD